MMRPVLASLVLAALFAPTALADGFIVVERPPEPEQRRIPSWRGFPLAVQRHDVTVTIDGQVATTNVDQVFRNPTDMRLEGLYMFPLPEDAAIDSFSMWIDDQEMKGELLDREKALEIYEGIVRRMQDPALLEYAGRGMFKVRIFPIEPRGLKRVRLTYRQVLRYDAGRCRYVYPLNTEKFSSAPLEQATVSVSIKSETPIKGIYSPWHDVDVRRQGERAAVASWEARNTRPNRDFVIDFDLAPGDVGMSLRTHAVPAEDGTFLLLIAPKVELKPEERVAQDVVFVIDTSGSMTADGRMEQARRALSYCISRLEASDRFAVVDFATDARTWRDELTAATDENKEGAQAYVRGLVARGGTAIDDALGRALRFRASRDATRPLAVVFLTDGQPTIGETEPDRIIENLKKAPAVADARVFVWGVGGDLNTHLLDRIALDHRGERYYVLPGEDVEVAMSNFYDTIASPVLTDLELTFEGAVRVNDVYPRRLGDLFSGHQLVVVGRFTGEGHAAVRLKGKLMGQPREFVYEGKFERHEQNAHVPTLWARRKIGFLLDEIRLRGESQEVKDEVIRLARRHGLPTPYTSYLVLEEGAQASRGQPRPPGAPAPLSAPAEDAAADAFGRVAREAEAERRANGPAGGAQGRDGEFAQAPSAAPSGEDAVRLAQSASRMRSGDKAEQDDVAGVSREVIEQSIRTVGDRTFYRHGEVWVESTIGARTPGSKWTTIALWSDEHFALLRARPELGQFMALGKVIFKAGDTTYELK